MWFILLRTKLYVCFDGRSSVDSFTSDLRVGAIHSQTVSQWQSAWAAVERPAVAGIGTV